jgi:hypothetical protein
MSRVVYEVRVIGELPAGLLADFSNVTVAPDPAGATMRADLADAAELHGFLSALSRGGLELVDVRREHLIDRLDSNDPADEMAPPQGLREPGQP